MKYRLVLAVFPLLLSIIATEVFAEETYLSVTSGAGYQSTKTLVPSSQTTDWKVQADGNDAYYTHCKRMDTGVLEDWHFDLLGDYYVNNYTVSNLAAYAELKFYLETNGGIGATAWAYYERQ